MSEGVQVVFYHLLWGEGFNISDHSRPASEAILMTFRWRTDVEPTFIAGLLAK